MTTARKFWDKAAQKYAASPIGDMPSYEYTMERTRSYLSAEAKVLEIGCGTGSTALLLAADAGHITATDVSPEMVRIGEKKAEGVVNLSFAVMTGEEAAQAAKGHDVVLGFNIFHLTEDPDRIFATLHQQLAPGALFISKTPCLAEPAIGIKRFAFAALIPVMRLVGFAPFVRRFTFAQLERKIESAGFEIVETGSFPAMSRFVVARRRA